MRFILRMFARMNFGDDEHGLGMVGRIILPYR